VGEEIARFNSLPLPGEETFIKVLEDFGDVSPGMFKSEKLRNSMDNFANLWKQDSWHPYQMPRQVVGCCGIGCAALFVYVAYVAITR
jgi:hypothetical protein